MNQTFNFSRWWMLVTAHWAQNRKRYGLSLLAMGGILAAWYSFLLVVVGNGPLEDYLQSATYFVSLYFIGCLYASSLFAELGDRATGINYLSVPGSHPEKLFCALLFGVIGFFIAYTLLFYAVDIPFVQIANRMKMEGKFLGLGPNIDSHSDVVNIFSEKLGSNPGIPIRYFLLGFFAIQSIYILGSIWFTRYAFIKTTVGILLFLLIIMIFTKEVVEKIIPEGWHMYGWFGWWQNANVESTRIVRLPVRTQGYLLFLMEYSLPFIFWTIAYFRLKEKEV